MIKFENSHLPIYHYNNGSQTNYDLHVLYLAPLKAIVEEKCAQWLVKFGPFGLRCLTLTGDTTEENFKDVHESAYMNVNIICATPEKFDHIIRTDKKSRDLLNILQLIMIDEVHILSDKSRGTFYILFFYLAKLILILGDVLEATITRIKSIRNISQYSMGLTIY